MWKSGIILLFFFKCSVSLGQLKDSLSFKLSDTLEMEEIVINAKTRIAVQGDTISYLVDSFYNNPQAMTEDVLKRLPGVEVSSDGTITVHGKVVSKIFINGKEYYANDLRTVTQNLPAEILEKIQIADLYDEEAQFSGVRQNAKQKMVNLQFKKQYQQGVFGRVNLGYGTKRRYTGTGFVNYINGDFNVSNISSANNIGIATANSDKDVVNMTSLNNLGITTTKQTNLNFSFDPNAISKTSGSYEIANKQTDLDKQLNRTTYLPGDSLLLRRQTSASDLNYLQHRFNVKNSYRVNTQLNLINELRIAYVTQRNEIQEIDQLRYQSANSNSFERTFHSSSNISAPTAHLTNIVQKSFSKTGRRFSLRINTMLNSNNRNGSNESINRYLSLLSTNQTSFESEELTANFNVRTNLQYIEPIGEKGSLLAKYSLVAVQGKTDREVWRVNGTKQIDTAQTNIFENRNTEHPVGLLYQYKTSKFSAGAGTDIVFYKRSSENRLTQAIVQRGYNMFPNAFLQYLLNSKATIEFNYQGNIISPMIRQLQSIPDYTDSLNVFIGNPNLRPEQMHVFSVSYKYFFNSMKDILWLTFVANAVNNKIIDVETIAASRRIRTPMNIDGLYSYMLSFNYTKALFAQKLKTSVSFNGRRSNDITIVNGQQIVVENYTMQPAGKVLILINDFMESELRYTLNTSQFYSQQRNTSWQIHTFIASGSVSLPFKTKFTCFLNAVLNDGLGAGYEDRFLLVNASIDKDLLNSRLFLRLQAFDMLNNYPSVTRTTGENYFEDQSINRIGRYFMVSLTYRFNHFVKNN